jgi:hypothetical protein
MSALLHATSFGTGTCVPTIQRTLFRVATPRSAARRPCDDVHLRQLHGALGARPTRPGFAMSREARRAVGETPFHGESVGRRSRHGQSMRVRVPGGITARVEPRLCAWRPTRASPLFAIVLRDCFSHFNAKGSASRDWPPRCRCALQYRQAATMFRLGASAAVGSRQQGAQRYIGNAGQLSQGFQDSVQNCLESQNT